LHEIRAFIEGAGVRQANKSMGLTAEA